MASRGRERTRQGLKVLEGDEWHESDFCWSVITYSCVRQTVIAFQTWVSFWTWSLLSFLWSSQHSTRVTATWDRSTRSDKSSTKKSWNHRFPGGLEGNFIQGTIGLEMEARGKFQYLEQFLLPRLVRFFYSLQKMFHSISFIFDFRCFVRLWSMMNVAFFLIISSYQETLRADHSLLRSSRNRLCSSFGGCGTEFHHFSAARKTEGMLLSCCWCQ